MNIQQHKQQLKRITTEIPEHILKKWILLETKVCPFCLKDGVIRYMFCRNHNYTYDRWFIGMIRFVLGLDGG